MNTAILALMLSAAAPQVPAAVPAQKVVVVLPAPSSAAAEYNALADKYAAKAAEYREKAANPPAHAAFLESKHPMAPNTRAHSKFFAEKYEAKAEEAREIAAKLTAADEASAAVDE